MTGAEKGERLETYTLATAGLAKGLFEVCIREPLGNMLEQRRTRNNAALSRRAIGRPEEVIVADFEKPEPVERPPIAA